MKKDLTEGYKSHFIDEMYAELTEELKKEVLAARELAKNKSTAKEEVTEESK